MPKILRNYVIEQGQIKLCDFKGVFIDMPTALCDFGREYTKPIVVELENKQFMIFEKDEFDKLVKEQKEKSKEKESDK